MGDPRARPERGKRALINPTENKLKEYVDTLKYACALFLEIGTKEGCGAWSLDWIKQSNFEA